MEPMMLSLAMVGEMYQFQKRADGFVAVLSDDKQYLIDPENNTCSCPSFYFSGYKLRGFQCKHLEFYKEVKL